MMYLSGMSSVHLSDSLFDAVCEGNVDAVTALLKRGKDKYISMHTSLPMPRFNAEYSLTFDAKC